MLYATQNYNYVFSIKISEVKKLICDWCQGPLNWKINVSLGEIPENDLRSIYCKTQNIQPTLFAPTR